MRALSRETQPSSAGQIKSDDLIALGGIGETTSSCLELPRYGNVPLRYVLFLLAGARGCTTRLGSRSADLPGEQPAACRRDHRWYSYTALPSRSAQGPTVL